MINQELLNRWQFVIAISVALIGHLILLTLWQPQLGQTIPAKKPPTISLTFSTLEPPPKPITPPKKMVYPTEIEPIEIEPQKPAEPQPTPKPVKTIKVPSSLDRFIPEIIKKLYPSTKPRPTKPTVPSYTRPARKLSSLALINQSKDLLIQKQQKEIEMGLRVKPLSVNNRNPQERYYFEGWRRKIESVGRLNYPKEASNQAVKGDLKLRVIVKKNGEVENVQILQSSGYDYLDQAAIKIIHLAAPFSVIPEEVLGDAEALSIQQSWSFEPYRGFQQ